MSNPSKELLRLEEDILYSEKANFQLCNLWVVFYWILGLPNAILGGLTGLSAAQVMLADQTELFAILTAVISALMTFMNPNQRAEISHKAGVRYSDLRGRVRRYREMHLPKKKEDECLLDIESLFEEKTTLLSQTPHTGGLAYWLARWSIEKQKSHLNEVDKAS